PNLNFGGLAWLGGAPAVCLISVALRQPHGPGETRAGGKVPAAVDAAQQIEGQVTQRLTGVSPWIIPTLALLCHLAVVAGLFLIGKDHFQDAPPAVAAATLY